MILVVLGERVASGQVVCPGSRGVPGIGTQKNDLTPGFDIRRVPGFGGLGPDHPSFPKGGPDRPQGYPPPPQGFLPVGNLDNFFAKSDQSYMLGLR